MLSLRKIFTTRNIAAFLLVLFCIRYIPLETRAGPSMIKTNVSFLCLFLFVIYSPKISKAVILLSVYLSVVFISADFHPESFRWSTLLYLCSFAIVYITFYNLIFLEHAFSLDFYIKLLKGLIKAYAIVLLIQQMFIIVGVKIFPVINLVQFLDRGLGANSLSGEPSSSARILTVCFYALLKLTEYKYGYVLKLKELFSLYKWTIILFLYSMLTMGSGTAMVGLAILSLYFIRKQYLMFIIPLTAVIYISIPYINYEPLNRAYATVIATATMDVNEVRKTDRSASKRITPMLNTISNLDLTKSDTWFGKGIDTGIDNKKDIMIGGITDYGLISWGLFLAFMFTCCIRRVFSIETVIFVILLGAGIGNTAYAWGILMLFTVIRYFSINSSRKEFDE